jgi:hypothetical protein
MPKQLAVLTATQVASLEHLRQLYAHKEAPDSRFTFNDALYLRYLRARNFHTEKAVEMLDKTIAWRQEFGLHRMDEWMDVIRKENETGKTYVRGFDKEGHVIIYMKPRCENTNDHDGNLKHLVYNLEKAIQCMEARGSGNGNGNVEKLSLVVDYHGFSLLNAPPLKTSLAVLSILQNHYPERLFRAYCVRPPWIFSTSYAAISPFIDPITKHKILMMSGNFDTIKSQLLDAIDKSVLEADFGGEDARPFNSSVYLSSPMPQDFNALLNSASTSESEVVALK